MNNPIHNQIQAKIEAFARELEALVRQAAVGAVADALGTHGAASKAPALAKAGKKRGPKPKAAAPKAAAAPVAAAPKAATKRGGKRKSRSPQAVGAAAEQILKHIKANPGQRSEQVRASVGIAKNVWIPAVAKLIEDKKIVKKGEKRATSFTAK